jgi:peroxin-2
MASAYDQPSFQRTDYETACRYRTLADRLLRLQLVPAQRLMRRDVSYEFMNRQMVWHAFTVSLRLIVLFLLCITNIV